MLTYPESWGPSEWGEAAAAAGWELLDCCTDAQNCLVAGPTLRSCLIAGLMVWDMFQRQLRGVFSPCTLISICPHHAAFYATLICPGPIPFLPDNDILVQRLERQWGELGKYQGIR